MYQSQMSECVRRNSISAGRYTYIHIYTKASLHSGWVRVPLFLPAGATFHFVAVFSGRAFWVGTLPAVFAGRCDISFCFHFVFVFRPAA